LIEAGFTIDDIDRMDVRTQYHTIDMIVRQKEIDRLKNVMDIANGCRLGFASVQGKENAKLFEKWQRTIERQIDSLNYVIDKKPTIWDNLKRSTKIM
jgi:hypothetical protein